MVEQDTTGVVVEMEEEGEVKLEEEEVEVLGEQVLHQVKVRMASCFFGLMLMNVDS